MSRLPAVIAHRGASAYFPEHTREAKALAYGQGADFLEQDVVATRDRQLVVLHDLWLDDVTDVAARFPQRRRADGRYYVVDFELQELESLRVVERRVRRTGGRAYPERFGDDEVAFRIVSLDEEIRLVRELNRMTGRRVGIYPEIKEPRFHGRHGIDLASLLLEALERHGYRESSDPVVVQCFDAGELRRCRSELGTALRLAQLVDAQPGDEALAPGSVAAVAEYAQILAPPWSALLRPASSVGAAPQVAAAAREAKRAGLDLHPWTFRRETVPGSFASLEAQLAFYFGEVEVAGVFCDHPDVAVRVRDEVLAGR
jgi:glycerophosphoryl diester phosphodiesterase